MTGMRAIGIGAMLTEAREARGITLEQAERETRIARRYLVALEQEDFAVFPAEVYARGFLRSYAGYLHLNPDDLLALLPRTDGSHDGLPSRRPGRPARHGRPAGRARAAEPRPATGRGPAVLGLTASVLVALLVAFLIGRLASAGPSPLSSAARVGERGAFAVPPSQPISPSPAAAHRMPDLRGVDERAALSRLQELGITPFVIEIPSREGPAGTVIRQSPAPNEPVGDRVVTVVISRGG
jgi:cytoskeletal protein RodZ